MNAANDFSLFFVFLAICTTLSRFFFGFFLLSAVFVLITQTVCASSAAQLPHFVISRIFPSLAKRRGFPLSFSFHRHFLYNAYTVYDRTQPFLYHRCSQYKRFIFRTMCMCDTPRPPISSQITHEIRLRRDQCLFWDRGNEMRAFERNFRDRVVNE